MKTDYTGRKFTMPTFQVIESSYILCPLNTICIPHPFHTLEWKWQHTLRISLNKVPHVHLLNVAAFCLGPNGKGKVVHAIKAHWEVEVYCHSFLTWTLDGGVGQLHAVSTLHPGRVPGINWLAGWLSPTASPFALEKRKNVFPHRESNRDSSVVQSEV
jgi:hypothetical protein